MSPAEDLASNPNSRSMYTCPGGARARGPVSSTYRYVKAYLRTLVGTFIYCVRAYVPTYVRAYVRTHTFCFARGRQPRLSAICLFRHSGIAASLQGIIPVLLYHVCLEFLASRHSTLRFALLSFDLRALCIVPRLPCTGTT